MEQTLVFYPDGFTPDARFHSELEKYMLRSHARLLWIENPQDKYQLWRCVSVVMPGGCIELGQYCIYLVRELSRTEDSITYQGEFACGDVCFETSDITLDLSGSRGTLSFSFSCRDQGADIFTALDAGMKYVLPLDPEAEDGARRGFVSVMTNRVLSYRGGAEKFLAHLTPCAFFDISQTYISIPRISYLSSLTTAGGTNLTLRACGDASLVFETTALSAAYDASQKQWEASSRDVYLGICGSFQADASELLAGLYGSEFIRIEGEIRFVPHQNAMICGEERSVRDVTAPWISVKGGYYSSAQSAPLYGLDNACLRPYPSLVSDLREDAPAFPVMFWNGAEFFSGAEAESAEQILYDMRYRLLTDRGALAVSASVPAERVLVTHNGLCVCVDEGTGAWKWMDIAHKDDDGDAIRLLNLSEKARVALLQKDCCIAISSAKEFSEFAKGVIAIDVDGWRISLSQTGWNDDSMLIFKYDVSQTLAGKMKDEGILRQVLEDAYDENGEVKEAYAPLMSALNDQGFNGIVMLNAPVAAGDLPDSMKMIARSLDPEKLSAAYVVIGSGSVSVDGGTFRFEPTPISGLVSYTDDELTAVGPNATYAFQTVRMHILFKNSHIVDFSCKSELLPAALLGETLESPECMVLLGSLEENAGVPVYRFFLDVPVSYSPEDSVVSSITISDVNLSESEGQGVFRLTADLALAVEEGCDVFSYDNLCLYNIRLIQDQRGIYDDYGEISISPDGKAREGSLAHSFGTYPLWFLVNQAASPDEQGFRSITCPVRQGKIGEGWNGVIHRIPLGDSGDLGGDMLELELITAWQGSNVYVGIRPAGTLGQSFLVQGSIRLGFGSIELVKENERLFFILHNLSLKVFGLSLPQKSADLFLFSDNGKTGWYLGYDDGETQG